MSNTNTSTDRIPVFNGPDGKIKINALGEKDVAKLVSTVGKVKQLDKASDLGRIVSYLKKLQLQEEVIEFNGQQYLVRSVEPIDSESELPSLDEVVDYYGLKDLIESVAALKGDLSKTGDIKATLNLADNLDNGWLLCNGAQISRTTYKNLWEFANDNNFVRATEAIADLDASEDLAFGPGDGSTTFSLPDVTNRFIEGNGTPGTYVDAGLPNITGHFPDGSDNDGYGPGGAFYKESWTHSAAYDGTVHPRVIGMNAARSSGIYGRSSSVQPPALRMYYIIKY